MADEIKNLENRIEKLESRVMVLEKTCLGNIQQSISKPKDNTKINFALNIRAYAKRYAADKSGAQKFVLLLAYLSKGKIGQNVELGTIKQHWDKMSAKNLLGNFNRFNSNYAKTQGWIDSPKYGAYCLAEGWQEVLELK